jgi:GH15 family glucan-1,4-alpha-glucosidase
MDILTKKSLELIRKYQSKEGAFYACPNFETYRFSWFRDGSFCALALSNYGYSQDARRFFQWSSRVVLRYKAKILQCIESAKRGDELIASECFHSRFTIEGDEVSGNWGHHQLDGLGTWLWALNEFHNTHPELTLPAEFNQSAGLIKDYLIAMWPFPCSDCWEENETRLHTYTLSAVFAGLESYAKLFVDPVAKIEAEKVRSFIFENCVNEGSFVKSIGLPEVDANLVGLVFPYHLLEWGDPFFQKTLARIQKDLITPIGVHRYLKDTYYGGGEWVLLTAWLGWAAARVGDVESACSIREWIEAQVTPQGELAEQIPHALFDIPSYDFWKKKWGPIASPLLWSHAMYILLVQSIEQGKERDLT